jgi:hypothetical protein
MLKILKSKTGAAPWSGLFFNFHYICFDFLTRSLSFLGSFGRRARVWASFICFDLVTRLGHSVFGQFRASPIRAWPDLVGNCMYVYFYSLKKHVHMN